MFRRKKAIKWSLEIGLEALYAGLESQRDEVLIRLAQEENPPLVCRIGSFLGVQMYVIQTVRSLLEASDLDGFEVHEVLEALILKISFEAPKKPKSEGLIWLFYSGLLRTLKKADEEISSQTGVVINSGEIVKAIQRDMQEKDRIIVPVEILWQAASQLFPAERLMIAGGRRFWKDSPVIVTTLFDVTDEQSRTAVYVKADQEKIGRATIALTASGAFMPFYVHSHPGNGAEATKPSQHTDWPQMEWFRANYPHMCGLIISPDLFVRVWGDDFVGVELLGTGIQVLGKKGDRDYGRVYSLA